MVPFMPEFTPKESQAITAEFQRLQDNTYLDHAGTTLYSELQVDAANRVLKENLFCNPHTCKVTGDLVDQVRFKILKHFNTDVQEYAVVFTANATAALKLVAECFDFGDGSFYYCQENHTSVLGMRDIVQTNDIFVLTKNELFQNLHDELHEEDKDQMLRSNLLEELHEEPKDQMLRGNSLEELHEELKDQMLRGNSLEKLHEKPKDQVLRSNSLEELHEEPKDQMLRGNSLEELHEKPKDQMLRSNSLEELHEEPKDQMLKSNSLVVFSAQCNFSGYKMPLEMIGKIKSNGLINCGKQIRGKSKKTIDPSQYFVCLDAASFVATNHLDLQVYQPDFICLSFYKIFGFPTGVGALLVSNRGQTVLRKRYYGGGTVKIAMTLEDFHEKREEFSKCFEDGTLPFLSIPAILEGFRTHERLIPTTDLMPMQRVSNHVFQLAKYCFGRLSELRHANGAPLITFYNHCGYENVKQQGGIITFNVMNDDGSFVGFAEIACIAAIHNVQLRTGCFCNPGACQSMLQLTNHEIRKQFEAGHVCSDYNDLVDGIPTGAVRLSFGYMTKQQDVEKAVAMIRDCYLKNINYRINLIEHSTLVPKDLQYVSESFKPRLKKICIYPVKSCGSYEILGSWEITARGFKFDRTWMVVDQNGMAITQKHHTGLCLIKPKIDLLTEQLELTFPDMKSIHLPLEMQVTAPSIITTICQSKICGDSVEGIDCGNDVADWLVECLQSPGLRLIKQNSHRRTQKGALQEISLANQAQYLLINRTSVRWLASKVVEIESEPVDCTVDRFRANLIIESPQPLEEIEFETLTIGKTRFEKSGLCTRCQMICIDQHTGQKTTEPLRTLGREFKGKIQFGIYLTLMETLGKNISTISCQDSILIERANKYTNKCFLKFSYKS